MAKTFLEMLAPPVQAFPKARWLLLRAIKDILQGLGSPFFRRTHVKKEWLLASKRICQPNSHTGSKRGVIV